MFPSQNYGIRMSRSKSYILFQSIKAKCYLTIYVLHKICMKKTETLIKDIKEELNKWRDLHNHL